MKQPGEVHQALLQACKDLQRPDRAPTLREMAHHARVGMKSARDTVRNMRRAGVLDVPRTRRVAYRNKPVNEYVPVQRTKRCAPVARGLASVMTAWVG
ncbi:hypothetical protein BA022_08050 [Diaphorobacter nitroreducens]|uniref:hypothetical protein n=1 Tax=Diaphorobacter nitroreducens TaxID=164759 RepID=UPI000B59D32D|nr:hypothetical protein [Diaphorobacter nitroreducens]ASI68512.1 hypothetical protein BA022_08050 [Diaphorobacter nitroreducens]